MTVDELISKLAKPIYVYRLARAQLDKTDPYRRRGAETRMKNAEREIEEILFQYLNEDSVTRQLMKG
jgi:hypothetical protein